MSNAPMKLVVALDLDFDFRFLEPRYYGSFMPLEPAKGRLHADADYLNICGVEADCCIICYRMAFSNFAVQTLKVVKVGNLVKLMGTSYFSGSDLGLVFRFEDGGQFLHGFLRWDFETATRDFTSTLPWQAEAEDWEFLYSDSNSNSNFFLGCDGLTLKSYFWQTGASATDQPVNTYRLEYTSDQPQQVLFADFYLGQFRVFV